MLTTIEEKLSAIKAINEEKDTVENELMELTVMESVEFQTLDFTSVPNLSVKPAYSFPVNPTMAKHFIALLKQDREKRKKELIEKAVELMK